MARGGTLTGRNLTESQATEPNDLKRRIRSSQVDRDKIMARLRCLEDQIREVQRLVNENQYRAGVLVHPSALISAARLAGLIVLDDQISGCALGT